MFSSKPKTNVDCTSVKAIHKLLKYDFSKKYCWQLPYPKTSQSQQQTEKQLLIATALLQSKNYSNTNLPNCFLIAARMSTSVGIWTYRMSRQGTKKWSNFFSRPVGSTNRTSLIVTFINPSTWNNKQIVVGSGRKSCWPLGYSAQGSTWFPTRTHY